MSPEERDRMVSLEIKIDRLIKEVEDMGIIVIRLDRQSTLVRAGFIIILAFGGIATWFSNLFSKWFQTQ